MIKMDPISNLSRDRLIRQLNEDLAAKFRDIVACLVYSNILEHSAYTEIANNLERHAAANFKLTQRIAKQISRLGGVPVVAPMAAA